MLRHRVRRHRPRTTCAGHAPTSRSSPRSRRGVEAFVEPATNVTATTVILIAHDGEWMRRAVPTREDAFRVATELHLPTYDVNQTGYPQRMRDWNSRQRRGR